MKRYFGEFTDHKQMLAEWGNIVKGPIPTDEEVLFASYGAKHYEGDAIVLFVHDAKLYEVHGGHCSCYGLSESGYSGGVESQWSPEETTWEAISKWESWKRPTSGEYEQHEPEAVDAFNQLLVNKGLSRG